MKESEESWILSIDEKNRTKKLRGIGKSKRTVEEKKKKNEEMYTNTRSRRKKKEIKTS